MTERVEYIFLCTLRDHDEGSVGICGVPRLSEKYVVSSTRALLPILRKKS